MKHTPTIVEKHRRNTCIWFTVITTELTHMKDQAILYQHIEEGRRDVAQPPSEARLASCCGISKLSYSGGESGSRLLNAIAATIDASVIDLIHQTLEDAPLVAEPSMREFRGVGNKLVNSKAVGTGNLCVEL